MVGHVAGVGGSEVHKVFGRETWVKETIWKTKA